MGAPESPARTDDGDGNRSAPGQSDGARVGVDVGGTFTDLVAVRDGRVHVEKTPSTPDGPDRAVGTALDAVASAVPPSVVSFVAHGTTVATNAVLEREWADTALVTTAGFADVLEIGRQDRPDIYDVDATKPAPIVPRNRRYGVPERRDERGRVVEALDEAAVREVGRELASAGTDVESVAVCLLFSFEDGAHERRVRELLREAGVEAPISLSSVAHPEIREYERTLTTALDAALAPVMERYLGRLERRLDDRDVPAELAVMGSGGGVMTAEDARERPVRTLLSGPAAGVRGAARVAAESGYEDLVTMDMGGTSCDVALVEGGEPVVTTETTLGEYPVGVPAVDVHAVGSGGGSIARVDAGGALRVGPRSAGAEPGPVCYGRDGTEPTTTDAHALLGRIDPGRLVESPAGAGRVGEAVAPIADALDRDVEGAAAGVLAVANAAMERAIRVVTVERGRDPRELSLVAFGGAGPLHAPAIAASLGVPRVLVPRAAGVLSAYGLLASDVIYDRSTSRVRPWSAVEADDVEATLRDLETSGGERLAAAGVPPEDRQFERTADVRYGGQTYDVSVPVPGSRDEPIGAADLDAVADAFHERHERRYGHADPSEPLELVTLRVRARGLVSAPDLRPESAGGEGDETVDANDDGVDDAVKEHRSVGFGTERRESPVFERERLPTGATIEGPAVVEGPASTLAVPPGQRATVDERGTIVVEVER